MRLVRNDLSDNIRSAPASQAGLEARGGQGGEQLPPPTPGDSVAAMYVPLWLIGLTALAFLVLLRLAFRGAYGGPSTGSGQAEMIERQRHAAPPTLAPGEEAALRARPDVAAALASGSKIEAIKALREASGLGLKEAKELVERWEGGD